MRVVGLVDAAAIAGFDVAVGKLGGVKKCTSRGMYRQGASAINELSIQYQGEQAELISGIVKAGAQADAGLTLAEASAGTIILAKPTVSKKVPAPDKSVRIVVNQFVTGKDIRDSMGDLIYGLCLAELMKRSDLTVIGAADFDKVVVRVRQEDSLSEDAALKKALLSCGANTLIVGNVEKTAKGYLIAVKAMDASLKVQRSESMALSSQDEVDVAAKLLVKVVMLGITPPSSVSPSPHEMQK